MQLSFLSRTAIVSGLAAALLLLTATAAFALHNSEHYSLFGDASYVSPGNASNRAVELQSDADSIFSGIDYGVESGLTFADVSQLSTDYKFTAGSCGGGSPRFQIEVVDPVSGDDGNIFVYLGPPPSYSGCPLNVWANTGDLLEGANPVDSSQLSGGTFYDPYTSALAKYGTYNVTGIQIVADAGWMFPGGQVVNVDNTLVDSTLFTYEVPVPTNADQCKKGGWMTLADANGNSFKNQGQCVSYVQKNKHN